MRLHSDTITRHDLQDARDYAVNAVPHGYIYFDTASLRGSRSRHHAWEVKLEGDGSVSRRRSNPGTGTGPRFYAATYDQWGHFLAYLYRLDPRLVVTGAYADRDDFEDKTHGAYISPADVSA